MKTYGLIVADTGSDMYVSGVFDTRWNNGQLNPAFRAVKAGDFEVIELGWRGNTGPCEAPGVPASFSGTGAGLGASFSWAAPASGGPVTDYLLEAGVRARYLHSEIDTLDRIAIIRELRLGEFDVLVGVNLLREGLDLPEVSLVAILDADKEGFLRGKTALLQTIGRAARNVNGTVLMYADKLTEAIQGALDETNRRRAAQLAYNEEQGITPESIVKGVSDIAELLALESPTVPGRRRRGKQEVSGMSREELEKLVVTLEEEMYVAAEELRFEYAAKLRDEIKELRRELNALADTPV